MRKVRLMRRFAGWLEKQWIGERRFILVSNNCWGYQLYNDLERNYNTPFVGLFVLPDCYLALLADFERSMSGDIVMGHHSRYRSEPTRYPVGVLPCGAEIHFLHYRDVNDALSKWQRRCERLRAAMDADEPLYLKLCDFDGTSAEQFAQFHAIPFGVKCLLACSRLRFRITWVGRRSPIGKRGVWAAVLGSTTKEIIGSILVSGSVLAWCDIPCARACWA